MASKYELVSRQKAKWLMINKYNNRTCWTWIHSGSYVTPIVTTPKRSLGQGNMFTGMCLSTGGGGTWPGTLPRTRCTPGSRHPPWEQTPPGADTPPQEQTPPGADPRGADTPRVDTPQCRACWEIRSTCGQYASYWNAILSCLFT